MTDWLIALFLAFGTPVPNTSEFAHKFADFMDRHEMGPTYLCVMTEEGGSTYYRYWCSSMRQRAESLYDAPRSCEVDRLPNVRFLSEQLEFGRRYREYVGKQMDYDLVNTEWWLEAKAEAELFARVYETAKYAAQSEQTYLRRGYLKELKELWPAWYSYGTLPPPVPVWRFAEID